jgi:hypothetical protein
MPKQKTCICSVCKRKVYEHDMTIHHWLPKSQGGTLKETFNLCLTCHSFLHYFIPIEEVHLFKTPESLKYNNLFNNYLFWVKDKKSLSVYKIKKVIDELLNYEEVA